MGVFHVFKIVQMLSNSAAHHIFVTEICGEKLLQNNSGASYFVLKKKKNSHEKYFIVHIDYPVVSEKAFPQRFSNTSYFEKTCKIHEKTLISTFV